MVITQYSNFFSLIIYGLLLIPAAVLGFSGQKIKWYGMLISIPSLCLVMGLHSHQMLQFVIFLACEAVLLMGYFYLHRKFKNNFIYYSTLILSMLPIILIKSAAHSSNLSFIGFIGISYVSFRIWQLIIEIHDNHIEKLSLHTMLYFITFFPTISSGPIDRYNRFTNDLERRFSPSEYLNDYLLFAVKKIFIGVIYKFAIATIINLYIIDKIPKEISLGSTVIYMYAYTLYLFFDFAGYSNFAIGTSCILGIKSPENFNKPFLARNMKEFWERWHMSLSKWFTDYLFSRFVLNVMRSGKIKNKKVVVRLGYMITMTAMGIWHGFYLFYILYGVYQGIMLVFTDIYVKSKTYRKFKKSKYYDIVSRVVCFQVIAFGMLLFSGYLFKF